MNILDKIIEQKKLEINNARSTVSIEQLKKKKLFHRKVYSLKDFLLDKTKTGIIAEFKRKSPSKGI